MMRTIRTVGLGLMLALSGACGGTSPAAPTVTQGSVAVATGPQVLRLTQTGFLSCFNGASINPQAYTRVTVTQAGSEWVVSASSPASGDIEMRFHQSGTSVAGGAMAIEGTIRGQAIHLPELAAGLAAWTTRFTFATGSTATITGSAYGVSPHTPTGGLSGTGSGSFSMTDNAGGSCGGTTFSWTVATS